MYTHNIYTSLSLSLSPSLPLCMYIYIYICTYAFAYLASRTGGPGPERAGPRLPGQAAHLSMNNNSNKHI